MVYRVLLEFRTVFLPNNIETGKNLREELELFPGWNVGLARNTCGVTVQILI